MWWHDMGMGWGMFGIAHMALWWVLIAVAIVVLVRWLTRQQSRGDRVESRAIDILNERYARGEIGKEEFDRMKHDLTVR